MYNGASEREVATVLSVDDRRGNSSATERRSRQTVAPRRGRNKEKKEEKEDRPSVISFMSVVGLFFSSFLFFFFLEGWNTINKPLCSVSPLDYCVYNIGSRWYPWAKADPAERQFENTRWLKML